MTGPRPLALLARVRRRAPSALLRGRAAPLRGRAAPIALALALARRHAVFLALLLAGTALRVVTQVAHRPALVYFDSVPYLESAETLDPHEVRPLGYPVFLRLLLGDDLAVVPLAQHVLGLLVGVLLYALLLRLRVPRWGAALAAAPVLLDAYQLNIEQYVLSETLYVSLIAGACALVLWHRRPGPSACAAAGLLLGAAAVTRASGLLVAVPALLAVAALGRRPLPVMALAVAFAAPVAGYAAWFNSVHGVYGVTSYGGRFLYARVAPLADCREFAVPVHERVLCEPPGARATVEEYMWSRRRSPIFRVRVPAGMTRAQVGGDFARRVIRHQPLAYASRVGRDFLRGFAPTRTRRRGELPIARWQFQLHYPIHREDVLDTLRRFGAGSGTVDPGPARFLRSYQRFGYVPNVLLGFGLLAAAAAVAGIGHARRSGLRAATFLFAATALAVLLPAAAANQFTWRYQIPQLALLPPAAALALTALVRRRNPDGPAGPAAAGAPGSPPGDG